MNDEISKEMDKLNEMRLPELQERYEEVVGEPTRAPNKTYLIRRIVAVLEAQAARRGAEARETATPEVSREGDATGEDAADVEPDEAASDNLDSDATAEGSGEIAESAYEDEGPEEHDEEELQAQAGDEVAESEEGSHEEIEDTVEGEPAPVSAQERPAESAEEARPPLRDLTVEQLQQRYREVVGRPTGSSHLGYLKWKIRQAEKGLIPVGPARNRRSEGDQDFKVLPLRMHAQIVEQMDEAWRRLGLKNRMELFRKAISTYLAERGEEEAALSVQADGRHSIE